MDAAEAAADGAVDAAVEAAAEGAVEAADDGALEVPDDEQAAKVSAAIAASPANRVSER
jgi:hypothetical protein